VRIKIRSKWRKMAEVYRYFCPKEDCYDFSESMALEMYSFESTGQPKFTYYERRSNGKYNGYAVGKHWMDATIKMWNQDLLQTPESGPRLFIEELLDSGYEIDFLKRVCIPKSIERYRNRVAQIKGGG